MKLKLGILLSLLVLYCCFHTSEYTMDDLTSEILHSSVMITNSQQSIGGSGTILRSSSMKSIVLTNAHVCRGLGSEVIVKTFTGSVSPVSSMAISVVHDLCVITVYSDLGVKTRIAKLPPIIGTDAFASGHPFLMPTVVSIGKFVGKQIITVGEPDPTCADIPFFCPLKTENFEAEVVSTTISPGSSGSGIFNRAGELSAVVFAGQGPFGYAMAVPLEFIYEFLFVERKGLIGTQ